MNIFRAVGGNIQIFSYIFTIFSRIFADATSYEKKYGNRASYSQADIFGQCKSKFSSKSDEEKYLKDVASWSQMRARAIPLCKDRGKHTRKRQFLPK